MNELQQLIDLSDQWIKDTCERKHKVSIERKKSCTGWKIRGALSASMGAWLVITGILTQQWGFVAISLLFVIPFIQCICYLKSGDKDWADLEQLCQDRIDELIAERDEYKREQKEEHGL